MHTKPLAHDVATSTGKGRAGSDRATYVAYTAGHQQICTVVADAPPTPPRSDAANALPTYRGRIVPAHAKHNPCKLCEVDRFLAVHQGREHMLNLKICNKYAVHPEPMITSAGAEPTGEELTEEQRKAIATSCGIKLLSLGM